MDTAKTEAQRMISDLPNDATLEDIQYHLFVLDAVRSGLAETAAGGVPHDEARVRFPTLLQP